MIHDDLNSFGKSTVALEFQQVLADEKMPPDSSVSCYM